MYPSQSGCKTGLFAGKFMARTFALLTLVLLHACNAHPLAGELPAVLETSTPASRAELVQVISDALNVVSVTLAEDALMKSSELVIEKKLRRNLQGRIGGGRVTDPPEQFKLVIDGSRCVLVRLADDTRYVLKEALCRRL